ncbi:hypothetical protein CPter291_0808 [Collimonas pratensis]|uniref:Lipoprotein n=1 Tax=Collimonas pratensis TaxID=279113 RepID=A0A127PZR6_9BURK|nr:hypothetical protein CPter91_0891 [Collimonas pratensis]AMP13087.1 hypothetical protein CPter291_0808 [Collimonas pratensis]
MRRRAAFNLQYLTMTTQNFHRTCQPAATSAAALCRVVKAKKQQLI